MKIEGAAIIGPGDGSAAHQPSRTAVVLREQQQEGNHQEQTTDQEDKQLNSKGSDDVKIDSLVAKNGAQQQQGADASKEATLELFPEEIMPVGKTVASEDDEKKVNISASKTQMHELLLADEIRVPMVIVDEGIYQKASKTKAEEHHYLPPFPAVEGRARKGATTAKQSTDTIGYFHSVEPPSRDTSDVDPQAGMPGSPCGDAPLENLLRPGAVRVPGMLGPEHQVAVRPNYGSTPNAPPNDVILQAQRVPEVLVTASPDPWWRRHQWWLAGGASVVVVGIILAVVLTTVDLGVTNNQQEEPPTLSPTSTFEGFEFETEQLIVSVLPSAGALLANQSTPQYDALQWVVQQRIDNEESYSNTEVLQYYSLAALYFSTSAHNFTAGGRINRPDGWLNSSGWLTHTSVCGWYGVECTLSAGSSHGDEEVIIGLNLTDNGLFGTVVDDIAILADSLTLLDLSHNDLEGAIPENLGMLTSLTQLLLADNTLESSIPTSLGGLSSLRRLDLSANILGSTIPSELGGLNTLEELRLDGNDIIGEVPSTIGWLSSIVHLNVSENRLSFPLPSELGQLIRLETLDARSNSLLGPLPSEVGLLSNLDTLWLGENYIFDTIPSELSFLSSLTSLDLSNNLLTGMLERLPMFKLFNTHDQLSTLLLNGNFFQGSIPDVSPFTIDSVSVLDISSNLLTGRIPYEVHDLSNLEELRLSNNALSGDIPSSVAMLSRLVDLRLFNNSLTGTIPTEVGQLTELMHLNLRANTAHSDSTTLSGTIPTELWLLSALTHLNLEFNHFNGTLPSELRHATALETLELTDNHLEGTMPSDIGQLTNLTYLGLDDVFLSGTIPTEMGQLTALTALRVRWGDISGTIPSEFGLITDLKLLHLNENSLTGVIPWELGLLTALTGVRLDENSLRGIIPSKLGQLSELTYLDLGLNMLAGPTLSELGQLTALTSLGLYENSLFGRIPSELGRLTALEYLGLHLALLSGSIPSEVGQLTALTYMDLSHNQLSSGIPSELGMLSKLTRLQMSRNSFLNGTLPSELGRMGALALLYLSSNSISGSIPSEIGHLTSLEHMHIDYNFLTGPTPSEIGQLAVLEDIVLAFNSLTGSIPSEIGYLTLLEVVELSNNQISGTFPMEFGARGGRFRIVDLLNTSITGSVPVRFCDFEAYVEVDCGEIICSCCDCTRSPSMSYVPSFSLEPSLLPSRSPLPSMTVQPSSEPIMCSPFLSVASFGSRLDISGGDDLFEIIELPFLFNWRGEVEYPYMTVTTNGVIFPGDVRDTGVSNCLIDLCCAFWTGRIAVAQNDLDGGPNGSIYTARVDEAFVISWEGVGLYWSESPAATLNFQLFLYENGGIEMRWGEGNLDEGGFVAGLEDYSANVVMPATGSPFGLQGESSTWPSNQCRAFQPSDGWYIEVIP